MGTNRFDQDKRATDVFFSGLIVLSGVFLLLHLVQRIDIKAIWTFTGIGADLWLCWLGLSVRRALKPSRLLDIILSVVSVLELFLIFYKFKEPLFPQWMSLPWMLYPFIIGLVIPVDVNCEKDRKTFWGDVLVAVFFVFIYAFGEFIGSRMWIASYDKGGCEIAQAVAPITGLFKTVVLPFAMYFILKPVLSRNILKFSEVKWLKYFIIGLSALYFLGMSWMIFGRGHSVRFIFPLIMKNPFILIIGYYLFIYFKKRKAARP